MKLVFPDAKIPAPVVERNCCKVAKYFGVTCLDCNKPVRAPRVKNMCAKQREKTDPYEIWVSSTGWTWMVLKKNQANDDKPNAIWHCFVTSPCCPEGEYGDCYVNDIRPYARKVERVGL